MDIGFLIVNKDHDLFTYGLQKGGKWNKTIAFVVSVISGSDSIVIAM